MNVGYEIQKIASGNAFHQIAKIGILWLLLLWHVVHFIISMWFFALWFAQTLESYLIFGGFLKKYKTIDSDRLRYLAIVLDSEEAPHTLQVVELLQHLAQIGVKRVCLYDYEGLLKKSRKGIIKRLSYSKIFEDATKSDLIFDETPINLEFASFSDGKEAVAKAANYLFTKNLTGDQKEFTFTESHIDEALKATGYGQSDPDLLLVYGPARCHRGFPPWRIRYTEIVHMGPLKSMKYGSLKKAIHNFTKVHQKYGT